jgi:hypothetical protein
MDEAFEKLISYEYRPPSKSLLTPLRENGALFFDVRKTDEGAFITEVSFTDGIKAITKDVPDLLALSSCRTADMDVVAYHFPSRVEIEIRSGREKDICYTLEGLKYDAISIVGVFGDDFIFYAEDKSTARIIVAEERSNSLVPSKVFGISRGQLFHSFEAEVTSLGTNVTSNKRAIVFNMHNNDRCSSYIYTGDYIVRSQDYYAGVYDGNVVYYSPTKKWMLNDKPFVFGGNPFETMIVFSCGWLVILDAKDDRGMQFIDNILVYKTLPLYIRMLSNNTLVTRRAIYRMGGTNDTTIVTLPIDEDDDFSVMLVRLS